MHKKGITIMAGTDCPIFFLTPGRSLHEELIVLNKAGIPALEVIQMATTKPAKYFNMENELGRINKGYIADLLLLEENPLEDIRNTLSINAVIKHGNYLSKEKLDKSIKASLSRALDSK